LVGRPSTNAVTEKYAKAFPVEFGPSSFVLNGDLFGHPGSAVIVAGVNPLAEKYSFVLVAGLSADATFHAVGHVMGAQPAEVVLIPAKGAARPIVVR
jgi:hypothetical protein